MIMYLMLFIREQNRVYREEWKRGSWWERTEKCNIVWKG
jgi:hypothetical protein